MLVTSSGVPNGSRAPKLNLRNVSISFLPQNTPPVIRSISVTAVSAANALKASNTQAASSSAFSVTVTDTGDAAGGIHLFLGRPDCFPTQQHPNSDHLAGR